MSVVRPYYAILGITEAANKQEIRKAYLRLAKRMHPDQGGDPIAFVDLNSAYTVLMDDGARELYDLTGNTGETNPLEYRDGVIKVVSQALDAVLNEAVAVGASVDQLDIVESLKKSIIQVNDKNKQHRYALERKMRELERISKRIKREGEERNIFVEIMKSHSIDASKELLDLNKIIKAADGALEELSYYTDPADAFRFMQAARYASWGSGNYTTMSDIQVFRD